MSTVQIPLLVHASHEAGVKMGGIGAVLDGLLGSPVYNAAVGRTILAGPINVQDRQEMDRLTTPANGLTILYSSVHRVNKVAQHLADALQAVEEQMHVRFIYGRRRFGEYEHEVILVDAQSIKAQVVNDYKYALWESWRLPSDRYESNREYNYYLSTGEPLCAALDVITADMPEDAGRYIIAHEWLGMPLVLSVLLHCPDRYKTVFYAHEVATARLLVENDKGHDTRFYNVLRAGLARGHSLSEVFGDQSWYYKQPIIERATLCDGIFAVGDLVLDELRFLGGNFRSAQISLVYNGVPDDQITIEQKQHSHDLLQDYAENLLGYRPDYVFSHVSRMVLSKGLWRDIRVLEHLDGLLAAAGKQAVLFVVSTATPSGRLPADVYRWEREYGWPLWHRRDNGDLVEDEVDYFLKTLQPFNLMSQAIRGILVNQFGWSRERCGRRMPAEMTFADLRAGTDLEFGQSIYEPFGIAQMEPLSAGALSVVSNVCGCTGFVNKVAGDRLLANVVIADYVTLPPYWQIRSPWDALWISQSVREDVEARHSQQVAQLVFERLPRDEAGTAHLLETGQNVARAMGWNVVVRDYLLPALAKL